MGHGASMGLYSYANGDPINMVDPRGRAPGSPDPSGVTKPGLIAGLWNEFTGFMSSVGNSAVNAPGYLTNWQDALSQGAGETIGFVRGLHGDVGGINKIGEILTNPGSLFGMPPSVGGLVSNWALGQLDVAMNSLEGELSRQAWFNQAAYDNGKPLGRASEIAATFIVPGGGEAGIVAKGESLAGRVTGEVVESGVRLSEKGLKLVEEHLATFEKWEPNESMVQRLRTALSNGEKVTGADANFYLHEANEATTIERLGYEGAEGAHAAALEKYGVKEFDLYHPEVIKTNPSEFNNAWRAYWGITNP